MPVQPALKYFLHPVALLDVKGQWKCLRTAAPVLSARLSKTVVASLVASRAGADPRARVHPQNKHKQCWAKVALAAMLATSSRWSMPSAAQSRGSIPSSRRPWAPCLR